VTDGFDDDWAPPGNKEEGAGEAGGPPGSEPAGKSPKQSRPVIKRTRFAKVGLDFSVIFAARFTSVDVNGFKPKLREPPSLSTGGGKQALQHIVLQPTVEGDAVVTVGHVNMVTLQAKLRTFDCVEQLHRLRFGRKPFPLDKIAYQRFFDTALEFFRAQGGMQVTIETQPPETEGARTRRAPPEGGGRTALWVLGFVALAAVAAATYFGLALLGKI
jgi:hypothetical protein